MKHCLKQRQKSTSFIVKVSDDWYPNGPDNTVEVFWDWKRNHIGIWGDDDFGMEKFNCTKEEFLQLKGKVLSQEICKKMGYVLA